MSFIKKKESYIVIKLTEENVKLIDPNLNYLTASRVAIVELLKSISKDQLSLLINSKGKFELKHFEGNGEELIETINDFGEITINVTDRSSKQGAKMVFN